MYIDKDTMISSAQVVTTTARSSEVIDLGSIRDIGVGSQKYLMVKADTLVTATGAGTVNFVLQCASDAAFSSPVTVYDSGSIAKGSGTNAATLIAGYQLFIPIPVGISQRYLSLNYVVGTGPLTGGSFTAAVVESPQLNKAYASAGA